MEERSLRDTEGKFKKGNVGFWLGKKRSSESVEKTRLGNLGQKRTEEQLVKFRITRPRGNQQKNWKGANASYEAMHAWVYRNRGNAKLCEDCGCIKIPLGKKRWFEWANISGEYKRELSDYKQLCKPCHKIFDTKNSKIITAFGVTKKLLEWLRDDRCLVDRKSLYQRIRRGWNHELALTKPKRRSSYSRLSIKYKRDA